MPALVWFPRSVESGSNWFLNRVSVAAPQTRYGRSFDDKRLCMEKWSFNLKSTLSAATVTGFHSVWVTLKSIFLQTLQTHTQSIQSISHNLLMMDQMWLFNGLLYIYIFFFFYHRCDELWLSDIILKWIRHFSERMPTWTAICVKSGLRRFFFNSFLCGWIVAITFPGTARLILNPELRINLVPLRRRFISAFHTSGHNCLSTQLGEFCDQSGKRSEWCRQCSKQP